MENAMEPNAYHISEGGIYGPINLFHSKDEQSSFVCVSVCVCVCVYVCVRGRESVCACAWVGDKVSVYPIWVIIEHIIGKIWSSCLSYKEQDILKVFLTFTNKHFGLILIFGNDTYIFQGGLLQ